jgi:UDP-glucose 4-epimerase
VVGGAGYIGSHCVRQLGAAGHRPVVLDDLSLGHRAAVAPGVAFHEVDLGAEAAVERVLRLERIDLVMHFAALASVGDSVKEPLRFYLANVSGTLRLLSAMRGAGVGRLVFSSSCAVFGEPQALPITEDLPQRPVNPYGRSKLQVEEVLLDLARRAGLSFAALRYFNAAGAAADGTLGEDHRPENHLIPLCIEVAMGRRPHLELFGTDYPTPDGTCLRDYVHVDDLARAHLAVFDQLADPGAALFYNLGTGRPTSNREVVRAVERASGRPVKVVERPRRPGDPPALYAAAARARAELGWQPAFPGIEAIVESAWRWHAAHPAGYGDARR